MKTKTVGLILLLALLVASGSVVAATAPYQLGWHVFGGGGGQATSTHYKLDFTLGQTAIGAASSSHYNLGLGYWPGVMIGAPPGAANKLFLPVMLRNHTTGF
jgi:hypothetical protein